MKITYEYDSIDDEADLHLVRNALKNHTAVYEVTLLLRNYRKHHEDDSDDISIQLNRLKAIIEKIEDHCGGLGYWDEY